jgi:serine phosphatase RsbU (regulator of sigma subunit)
MTKKIKNLASLLLFAVLYCNIISAQTNKVDSLFTIYNSESLPDSIRLNALIKYTGKLNAYSPDSALFYGEIALKLSRKLKSPNFEARSLRAIGRSLMEKYEYSKAVEYITKGMKISEATQDYKGLAASYNLMGITYALQNNRQQEMEYRLKAVKYAELSKDANILSTCYLNIGGAYMQSDINKSLEYKLKALKVYETSNDKDGIALCINQIGNTYLNMSDYTKALEYYKRAYSISLEIKKVNQLPADLGSIANVYNSLGNYKMALHYLDSSNYINDKYLNNLDYKINMYKLMEVSYAGLKQYDKAYLIKKESEAIEDSLFSDDKKKELTAQTQKFENEKKVLEEEKQKIIEVEEKKRQTLITITISIVLIITIIFSGFIFNRFKLTKKQKQVIEVKNQETEAQKHLIEEKHKEITDSINYAERIQRSFIATKEILDENLNDFFILFKPKDVVSGDFYWASKLKNGYFALATADSTGHGVPGAIMSLLNVTSLEKAIETHTQPSEILNATRKVIIERLKKDGSAEGGKDGMDASLTVYDFKNKKLIVAAANNPVWIVRGAETIEIKPDKMPVGKHDRDSVSFTQQEVDLQKGDVVYALTDGFPDQFGGETGKKFMSKNLRELLATNAHLPMSQQKELLEKTFTNWVGNLEQVDDVTLIGVRV